MILTVNEVDDEAEIGNAIRKETEKGIHIYETTIWILI